MIRKLCNVDQLPEEGKLRAVQGDGLDLCIGMLEGKPYAVQNACPHQGAPLAAGCLQESYVVCPYHAWRFRLSNGQPEQEGDPPLQTYEVRQYGSEIFLRLFQPVERP